MRQMRTAKLAEQSKAICAQAKLLAIGAGENVCIRECGCREWNKWGSDHMECPPKPLD